MGSEYDIMISYTEVVSVSTLCSRCSVIIDSSLSPHVL